METSVINILEMFFDDHKICNSHGFAHALSVYGHVCSAFSSSKKKICKRDEIIIKLAAMLHDADDRKFFPKSGDEKDQYPNAKKILSKAGCDESLIDEVCECISYISSSINGDKVPVQACIATYLLWPRHADRIDAIGYIGLHRLLVYARSQNRPLKTQKTPMLTDVDEVVRAAKLRYGKYDGVSESTMDHMLDKLITCGDAIQKCKNTYLSKHAKQRSQIMPRYYVKMCRLFSHGLSESEIMKLIDDEAQMYL